MPQTIKAKAPDRARAPASEAPRAPSEAAALNDLSPRGENLRSLSALARNGPAIVAQRNSLQAVFGPAIGRGVAQRNGSNSEGLEKARLSAAGKGLDGKKVKPTQEEIGLVVKEFAETGKERFAALEKGKEGGGGEAPETNISKISRTEFGRVETKLSVTERKGRFKKSASKVKAETSVYNLGMSERLKAETKEGKEKEEEGEGPAKKKPEYGDRIAHCTNTYEIEDGVITGMIAGDNHISAEGGEMVAKLKVYMNEVVSLQHTLVAEHLKTLKDAEVAISGAKGTSAAPAIKLPYKIVRTPTSETKTTLALTSKACSEALKPLVAMGSPHGSLPFQIALNLGLKPDQVAISFSVGITFTLGGK